MTDETKLMNASLMFQDLDDVRRDIATRLSRAVKDRKSPMHSPVISTSDADGRVMVLRAFDLDGWTLRFHTDSRSPKCGLIKKKPDVGVLFYDHKQKIQIRVRGKGRIEQDSLLANQAWKMSTNFARRCYLGEGPGVFSDSPTSGLPSWAEGIQPSDEQIKPAKDNFAILLIDIVSIDWLYLANKGHLRAKFVRKDQAWTSFWVTP